MQEMQELQNLHNQQQQGDHILVMSGHLETLKTESDLIVDNGDQQAQHIVVQMEHPKVEPVKAETSTWLKVCANRGVDKKNDWDTNSNCELFFLFLFFIF